VTVIRVDNHYIRILCSRAPFHGKLPSTFHPLLNTLIAFFYRKFNHFMHAIIEFYIIRQIFAISATTAAAAAAASAGGATASAAASSSSS
jgi:hypothetical protein